MDGLDEYAMQRTSKTALTAVIFISFVQPDPVVDQGLFACKAGWIVFRQVSLHSAYELSSA